MVISNHSSKFLDLLDIFPHGSVINVLDRDTSSSQSPVIYTNRERNMDLICRQGHFADSFLYLQIGLGDQLTFKIGPPSQPMTS